MLRSQKVGCVLLACIVLLEIFISTACRKTENKDSATAQAETSETEDEEPSSTGPESSSSETEPMKMDPVEKEAKEIASELGVSEKELHGRYDLFIKYADCIVNNPKLGEWRGYALHYFPIIADHLTEEYEGSFLEKVKDLRMISMPINDAGGDFNALGNTVRISGDGIVYQTDNTYTTIYHEMTHFLDAFAEGEESQEVCYTGERFAYEDDLTEEELAICLSDFSRYLYASFITEGGAELYMSKYFGRSPRAYYAESCFLIGIEWIYGSEALDTLFFSKDSTMRFIDMLKDAGYSDEKILSVFASFNYDTYARTEQPDDFICFEDVLVDLYEHVKGKNWKDDKVFCRILQQIHFGYSNMFEPAVENPEINDILVEYQDRFQWTKNIMDQIPDMQKAAYYDQLCVMIRNDKPYLATRLQFSDGSADQTVSAVEVEYDFDSEKMISYEYISYNYPTEVPKALSQGVELDARLESFVHDNSKAHQQTPYSGSSEMKDLYERACEIGNKYGVYIHVGEDLPEHLERGDASSHDALVKALDQVEEVLGSFPEGYFDQFNYGYYSGFDIVLCDWPIMNDLMVIRTNDEYIFHVALECRNKENVAMVKERLLDAIFAATDMKLKNYFENFETPEFSEEKWALLNPVEFSYSGYAEEGQTDHKYEEFKDYVTSKEAMLWAKKDRSQLMTAVMKSQDLTDECLKKAEYYCRMIREAFDDSTWPEETAWEKEIAEQTEESGEKAA